MVDARSETRSDARRLVTGLSRARPPRGHDAAMYRFRTGAPALRLGIAVACSLLVLTACSGPAAQSIPTPSGGGLSRDLPMSSAPRYPPRRRQPSNPDRRSRSSTSTRRRRRRNPPRAAAAATSLTKIGGCQVFPPNNPWNENVSNLPVNPNSAAYIASIDLTKQFLHPDFGSNPTYGIPYTVVNKSQPFVPITFDAYGDESNPGPYPIPLNAPGGVGQRPPRARRRHRQLPPL